MTELNRLPETNSGLVTSWIPIPTVWPKLEKCSQSYWSYVPNTLAVWDPGYGISVDPALTCLPKPVTTWWDMERLGSNPSTTISLGPLTCPEAYYTAYTSVKDPVSTLIGCCPRGYDFVAMSDAGSTGECTSQLRVGQVVTIATYGTAWGLTTMTMASTTPVMGIPVNGWTFATPTGDASATGTCSDNSLSPGSRASIGVGISLGVAGLAALIAGIWMMWKARKMTLERKHLTEVHNHQVYSRDQKGQELSVDPHLGSSPAISRHGSGHTYGYGNGYARPNGLAEVTAENLAPEVEPKVMGGTMSLYTGSNAARTGPASSRSRDTSFSQHRYT